MAGGSSTSAYVTSGRGASSTCLEGDNACHPLAAGGAGGAVGAGGGGYLVGRVEEVRGDRQGRQGGPARGPGGGLPGLDADHADEDLLGLGGGGRAGGVGRRGPGGARGGGDAGDAAGLVDAAGGVAGGGGRWEAEGGRQRPRTGPPAGWPWPCWRRPRCRPC